MKKTWLQLGRDGPPIFMTPVLQDGISSWAVKTVMVFEQILPHGVYYSPAERREFMRPPHVPPYETTVEIGILDPPQQRLVYKATDLNQLSPDCAPMRRASISLGPLCIRVISDRLMSNPMQYNFAINRPKPDNRGIRIHPRTVCFWPPAAPLTIKDLETW